jgi:sugar phosphate isomerase/epimerase
MKHEPTLMSADPDGRALRIDFLKRAIDIACDLGSEAVSLWSGILHEPLSPNAAMTRLAEGCAEVLEYATRRDMQLAFEPEPGMFLERLTQFEELQQRVDSPLFGLTVDVGHVHCVESDPIASCLQQWKSRIFNIHIEDMCRGVHEHLRFGDGEIDFGPVMQALHEIGYEGGVHVELSRHSHMAPQVARESFEFLCRFLPAASV